MSIFVGSSFIITVCVLCLVKRIRALPKTALPTVGSFMSLSKPGLFECSTDIFHYIEIRKTVPLCSANVSSLALDSTSSIITTQSCTVFSHRLHSEAERTVEREHRQRKDVSRQIIILFFFFFFFAR